MNYAEGEGIILPENMPVERLTEQDFKEARDALAGIIPAHQKGKLQSIITQLKERTDRAVERHRSQQDPESSTGARQGLMDDRYME